MANRKRNTDYLKIKDASTYNIADDILLEVPPFPKIMMIELTNMCNHKCSFCFNRDSTRKRGYIDGNLLASVLINAYPLGTREVGFYMTGESLMYEDMDKYVRLANQIGYDYIYLTTNGALLTPDKTEKLINAGINSVKLSINAATRETYKLIHGRDDFDRVIDNLRYLRKFRDENCGDVKIGASYILTNSNRHEKYLAEEMIGEVVDDIVFYDEGNQGGYKNSSNLLQNVIKAPCSMLFNRFHISHEGYFTLCCVDFQNYLAVADLNKVSLHDAWTSDIAIAMRKKHLTSRLDGTLCHNCISGENSAIEPLVARYASPFDVK